MQVISGKFLGDFQRHHDEKGYTIFDWVFETNPLAYFTALVGLSKIVGVPADVTHRDGSKPRSIEVRRPLLGTPGTGSAPGAISMAISRGLLAVIPPVGTRSPR